MTKTGALIVFAQNTELFNYAQTGVILRAKVTADLIENIFFKNTPLHDGAVIIAENKILAAVVSCRFRIRRICPVVWACGTGPPWD